MVCPHCGMYPYQHPNDDCPFVDAERVHEEIVWDGRVEDDGMSESDEDFHLHDYQGWTCPKCAKGEHEDCVGIRRTGKLGHVAVRDEVCVCPCPYPDTAYEQDDK